MVELMFVVAVIGILAAVAVTAYSRNVRKARAGEVPMMFGEFKAKEEAYYGENGSYLDLCGTPPCDESTFFPASLPGNGQQIDITGGVPASWATARIQPGRGSLYCQYVVISGAGGTAPAGTIGLELWNSTAPATNWYYMVSQCDWDGDPANNAMYWQRGDLSVMGRDNEGR
jgi:type IV pilus assembly protein PilA